MKRIFSISGNEWSAVGRKSGRRLALGLVLCATLMSTGCVVWRGADFGHWARTGDKIPLVRAFTVDQMPAWDGTEQFLVLPPQGKGIPPDLMKLLHQNLMAELRNYLPVNVHALADTPAADPLVEQGNLMTTGGTLDINEVSRLAALVKATHVVAVQVMEFRPYPPQKVALRLLVVDVALQQTLLNLDGTFDAAEQQVLLALSDHLQSRRARRFDIQSLEVMLQSPMEFSGFVCARCADAAAEELNIRSPFKKKTMVADNREGGAIR
jgi:hypothetical protein